ncbi:hypothetical protein EGH25_02985 [Haladaptatus sp. F3-133]|jgi:hypothetical protein|uniref:Uncharacterized protein n=1 Tax=Halorutilus salinus TaxID=2487751 RepID=A0A9Q4GG49_9EURY|nr:hypothetical protein [Halorutilus salinus]MCX2818317.1 hypothetical protein [Halorutilus salinus]
MNLDSRISAILPYPLLLIGILLYVSPFVPVLNHYDASYDLVFVAPSYVTAGAFGWLYMRGKIEKDSYVLAVPAVTFLLLTGMWLYFDFPGPYAVTARFVFGFGSLSFLYVTGHVAGVGDRIYAAASVVAYAVCLSVVVVLPPFDPWMFLSLFLVSVVTLVSGVPLALVGYVLSGVSTGS